MLWAFVTVAFSGWGATPVHLPYLQDMRTDRVTVVWSTRENLNGAVVWSTDRNFTTSTQVAAQTVLPFPKSMTLVSYDFYQYRVQLTGLSAGATYYYRVLTGGVPVGADSTFTLPAAGPYQFLAYGDSGAGTAEQRAVLNQMLKENPNFVIHVGDIAYENGTYDEFTNNHFAYYFSMMAHLPFFPVPGNHEYYSCGQGLCPDASPYRNLHALPTDTVSDADKLRYYSYDWGNTHFVALDANILYPDAPVPELNWLEADLAATKAKWKIVYWHQTPYPLLHHIDDPADIAAARWFVPILEKHGVQLVLTGHEHEYFRTRPMHGGVPVTSGPSTLYITSGGGGGPLHTVAAQPWLATGCNYPPGVPATVRPPDVAAAQLCAATWWNYLRVEVRDSQIVVHAIDMNGVEFDTATVTAPPSVNAGGVVNTASYTPALAAGGLVSIFGQDLATDTATAARYPLPTSLAGATVTLNGTVLPLFYASPQQINAQLPLNFVGPSTLEVTTAGGVSAAPVAVSAAAPAVFNFGVLHHSNGAPVTASSPAIAGELVDVYLTGLGQVNGTLAAGQAAPASPPLGVVASVNVDIGANSVVTPIFSGLTPGLAGVYQVSVTLPSDLTTNVYPLRVVAQGASSNVENIQVKARTP